ncbi:MAG TPA: hypothetical protein VIY26_16880, partial [Acidimicrobiales bacterium]
MSDDLSDHAPGEAAVPPPADPLGPITVERVARAAPGMARLAARSWWHLTEWTARTTIDTGRDLLGALASGARPTEAD